MAEQVERMDGEWLSYREIAERLDIPETAARQRVYDRKWNRRRSDEGEAIAFVPASELRKAGVSPSTILALADQSGALAQAGEGFTALMRYLAERDAKREETIRRQDERIAEQSQEIGDLKRQVRELKKRLDAYRVTSEDRKLGPDE